MKMSILALLVLVVCPSAYAQHYHGRGYYGPRVDFYFGAPYPWYAPPPVYYYPPPVVYPPVVVREAPTVYIEQGETLVQSAPAAPAVQPQQTFESGYWYYCAERRGYYPTVSSCPGAWQKVAPTPNR